MAPTPTEAPTLPKGPGAGFTFLYYFVGTALVTTLMATQTLGLSLETGIPSQFGLLFGAIGGLFGALLNRSTTLTLPCPSQKNFKQQLDTVLANMGYTEAEDARSDGILVYRRSPLRQAFSGQVYVLLDGKQAHLSSRVTHIRRLKKQLEQVGIR